MKLVVNSENRVFDSVQVTLSIVDITRQFTFTDVSIGQNYFKGDIVEVFDDEGNLLIVAEIEYIEAIGDKNNSQFVYAGRNNAKYIIDAYADETMQFAENQQLNSVISKVANRFGVKVTGDAKLPQEAIKTILVGDRVGESVLEVVQSAGHVIASDEKGDLIVEVEATRVSDKLFEYGINVVGRRLVYNSGEQFDKYIVASQSNYLVNEEQSVNVEGSYGSGKLAKVILAKNNLTQSECEELAKVEFKKDFRRSFTYSVSLDVQELQLNTAYFVKDDAVGIDELMNLKKIEMGASMEKDEMRVYFERIFKDG